MTDFLDRVVSKGAGFTSPFPQLSLPVDPLSLFQDLPPEPSEAPADNPPARGTKSEPAHERSRMRAETPHQGKTEATRTPPDPAPASPRVDEQRAVIADQHSQERAPDRGSLREPPRAERVSPQDRTEARLEPADSPADSALTIERDGRSSDPTARQAAAETQRTVQAVMPPAGEGASTTLLVEKVRIEPRETPEKTLERSEAEGREENARHEQPLEELQPRQRIADPIWEVLSSPSAEPRRTVEVHIGRVDVHLESDPEPRNDTPSLLALESHRSPARAADRQGRTFKRFALARRHLNRSWY